MKKNLQNSLSDFFLKKPTANQKAWSIINQFYHLILTKMDNENISRADLARKLDKSRASISQMFNKTPNITIKRMVEIADCVGLEINLTTNEFLSESEPKPKPVVIFVNNYERKTLETNDFSDTVVRSNRDHKYTANLTDQYVAGVL